ncbi:MAG TPA: CpsB/CapC family capsule biosynthesis tyrosine phosphatase [Myxococcaceae bacterium]|nr:CpsB/CapC family capsule biosynthesis tyrosine phosphatase [Myxococcaceae bacterium]
MEGYVDLHCHLLPGVDDGARTLEDAVEMARVLVDLGFAAAAPSPHARPDFAPEEVCRDRRRTLAEALERAAVPLRLHPNAENALVLDGFLDGLGTPRARTVNGGRYVLVEAPYHSPVPALPEMVFRMLRKGVTPLFAHPERCQEFDRPGRAAEVVRLGARLQLDLGALVNRYGPLARRLARTFLEEGLYAVAATDLHAPTGARAWLEKALAELRARAGEGAAKALLAEHPALILGDEELP